MSKTYAAEKAAAYCKCHAEAVRQYIRDGAIMASKSGCRYCTTQAALDVFLAKKENEQVQASLEHRSEGKCRPTYETISTTSISGRKAVVELDSLLAPKTNMRRNDCAIN